MKPTIKVDISSLDTPPTWGMDTTEHTYLICRNDDLYLENACFNGCPRCVEIACRIASEAVRYCNVVLIKEDT